VTKDNASSALARMGSDCVGSRATASKRGCTKRHWLGHICIDGVKRETQNEKQSKTYR
jgi:hypothetical protein